MDILIKGERVELPKIGDSYIDIRIYETGEVVIDGDQDKTAKAIELPPHGDLIERSKVHEAITQAYSIEDVPSIIDQLVPTVLEANNE